METSSIQQLVGDLTILFREEIELAKTELAEKIKAAAVGAGMLSGSAMAGIITLGCLTALAAVSLSIVIPSWAALLAVTVLWASVTIILALIGKRKVEDATPFLPEQTIKNVKQDVARARRRAKR